MAVEWENAALSVSVSVSVSAAAAESENATVSASVMPNWSIALWRTVTGTHQGAIQCS